MRLAHTMIRVRNLQPTLDFYAGFIGLKEIRRKQIGQAATLVWLSDGGSYSIELTLNHDEREYTQGNQFGHLAFYTDDLEAVIKEVEARHWWYRRAPQGSPSRYIFVKDPDGYDVEIIQA